MRVEFEVHTSHTKESFRILARMIYGAKAGWLRVLIFVLAIVIIAFGVIAMVQTGFSLSPLIVILLGCVLPLLNVRMVGKLSRAMAKSTGGTGGSLVYRFEEESFSLTDRDGRKDIAYGDVTKVITTSSYYYIFLKNDMCHCLGRKDFTEGAEPDFISFLKNKCDQRVLFGSYPGKYK